MLETVQDVTLQSPISLDQLAALNEEIAALSRAGLPLERGLLDAGRDLPGRLREVMTSLADRMKRGENLAQAMESQGDQFPRIYRAVVEAGLRGGRLSSALESLAAFVRGYVEARQSIGLALWYPLIVLSLAYVLFVFFTIEVVPRFLTMFDSLRIDLPVSLHWLSLLGEWAGYWGPILPAVLVLGLAWWVRSGKVVGFQPGRTWSLIRWFPWMNTLQKQFEAANFADLLAMLVEHGVPYPEAITLAAGATGDPRLVRACRALAESMERGEAPGAALNLKKDARAFPPLLRWLLATGAQQTMLVSALRNVGAIYRKRAIHQAEKMRVLLPALMLFAIGASATLFFGLTLFYPFATLLRDLAIPGQ